VLFGLPLRQTVGLVESLIRMAGLDWPVPDYSTLCRRQARIGVQIPYRRTGRPLNLLIDSTGVKFRGDGEWLPRKHGPSRRGQWRKVHIAMDTDTGDIRAVVFPWSSPRSQHHAAVAQKIHLSRLFRFPQTALIIKNYP
jgi:IS5 family transposase